MLFSSYTFLLQFLPAVVLAFAAARRHSPRAGILVLVCASLFFYGAWRPVYLLLLIGSIAVNFSLGLSMEDPLRRRAVGIVGVALNLALLCYFKYTNFIFESINMLTDAPLPFVDIVLPLGISFFTFQQIAYLVDVMRGAKVERDIVSYALFVSFFPHLIAGPLVHHAEMIPQFKRGRTGRSAVLAARGLSIFAAGLFKKVVIADNLAQFVSPVFAHLDGGGSVTTQWAWLATLSYTMQIYFDFSGYSDMAIGLARMLNVRFPLNFNSPYQACSITDFWRRWHITLSSFLRDYLYIPLGGNRRGEVRRHLNLMLTMLLGGLWHGAAWSFVLWGALHGAFLVVHGAWRRTGLVLPRLPAQVLTLVVVIVAWVPFRADGLPAAWAMLRGMAALNGIALPRMVVDWVPPLALIARPVPVLPYLGAARTLSFPEVSACLLLGWFIVLALPHVHQLSERARSWALTGGFAFTVQALFFAPNVTPFLYFRF